VKQELQKVIVSWHTLNSCNNLVKDWCLCASIDAWVTSFIFYIYIFVLSLVKGFCDTSSVS
jgi:hypothetical protein